MEATGEFDPSYRVTEDWDYVLRASEHARARGDANVATYYRRHGSAMTADTAAGEEAARRIVTEYFERNPELRGSRLERLAEARLLATSGRVRATHGQPAEGARRHWSALRIDPRAVGYEIAQIVQAVWGHLRYGQLGRMATALKPRRSILKDLPRHASGRRHALSACQAARTNVQGWTNAGHASVFDPYLFPTLGFASPSIFSLAARPLLPTKANQPEGWGAKPRVSRIAAPRIASPNRPAPDRGRRHLFLTDTAGP